MENQSDLAETYSSVDTWKLRLGPKTYRSYSYHLIDWLTWMQTHGGSLAGLSPDELVEYQRQTDKDNKYAILDLVQAWVGGKDWRYTSMKSAYSRIRSFFMHNRVELPRDGGFKVRSDKEPTEPKLEPEHIRDIVLSSTSVYRAIFLCMFQGGLDLSCFLYWNEHGWADLRKQLREDPDLVKITIPGRKDSRNKTRFYTLIGREAIDAITNYLPQRPKDGSAIFYNNIGEPVKKNSIQLYWLRHLDKIGLIDRSQNTEGTGRRYGYNIHEMRDTRSSLWEKSPAKVSVCEYTMGHMVDPLHYRDRSFKDETWVRTEYRKAISYLNIMTGSKPYGLVEEDTIQELETRVTELEKERDRALELSNYNLGRLEEAGVPTAPGDPVAERRQLKIDLADKVLEAQLLASRDPEAYKAKWMESGEIIRKLIDMARRPPGPDSIS